jgi:hypothetical protein
MDKACSRHRKEVSAYNILVRKHKTNRLLEFLGVDGRILEWILKKQCEKMWTAARWLKRERRAGFCEYGKEHSGAIKSM